MNVSETRISDVFNSKRSLDFAGCSWLLEVVGDMTFPVENVE